MIFRIIPIFVALICHILSFAIITVTFICNYWLVVISDSTNFGVWAYCLNNSSSCTSWNENPNSPYSIAYFNDSYKVFQAFQTIFLSLLVVAFMLVFLSTIHCQRLFWIFICAGCVHILSGIFGIISLAVYGSRVYNSSIHNLDWCYWISVVAVFCTLNAGVFIFTYAFDLKINSKRRGESSTTANDHTPSQETNFSFGKPNKMYRKNISDYDNDQAPRSSDQLNQVRRRSSTAEAFQTDAAVSSTPRLNQNQQPISGRQNDDGSIQKRNPRDRRIKPTRRLSKQKPRLSTYRERQKQKQADLRRANNYVDRLPKMNGDNRSEITGISSISRPQQQNNSKKKHDIDIASLNEKKFTFYNGVERYQSGLGLTDEFVEETLRKAKYQNTRPLLKYKRI